MKLEWNKIISNAVTVLVATVFLGAAAQLWNGVQTIDSRIDSNLGDIKATQAILSPKLDRVEERLTDLMLLVDPLLFPADPPGKKTQDLIDEQFQNQVQQRGY